MNVLIALEQARELLSDPAKWTQGYLARDKDGDSCPASSIDAVCFCALGAIHKVLGLDAFGNEWTAVHEIANSAYMLLAEVVYNVPADYNDTHTHVEVMDMYDQAISVARSRAKQ